MDATPELGQSVADLRERVARIEAALAQTPSPIESQLVDRLLALGDEVADVVVYAGSATTEDGLVAWKRPRGWADVLAADPVAAAAVFSALANPMRIRIVAALSERTLSTGELAEQLEEPTAGQLFHHLKDLLAAGLVYQPLRGTYAIRHSHLVPLAAALSVAIDLGNHHD